MERINTHFVVGLVLLLSVITVAPTASAHTCAYSEDCDDKSCPDDGDSHFHYQNTSKFCVALRDITVILRETLP